MDALIVYSAEKNRLCEKITGTLNELGITYKEISIRKDGAIIPVRSDSSFSMEHPVIQVIYGQMTMNFFTTDDRFWDGKLVREAVVDLVQGPGPV
jgi:hypothetical protein